jgi:uncharacterized protein (TIGR02996 family)
MSDEQSFLAALGANPADDLTRLVYADWLDDHADGRSRYLRLVCELARMPDADRLDSPAGDALIALHPVLDPEWQAAAGSRFEVALLEFSPQDRGSLILALMRLTGVEVPWGVEEVVNSAPAAVRSPMTYADAVFLYRDWLRYLGWFRVRPAVVVRPIAAPEFAASGLFDVVLRRLPREFWLNWPQYKYGVSGLFGLPYRDAAERVRRLPAVLFRAVPWADLEPTLRRVRRAFNHPGCELLPPDALSVLPHTPEGEPRLPAEPGRHRG